MENIKIGVFGAGRGSALANNFKLLGCDIVALCDSHIERTAKAAEKLGGNVALYNDFDKFIAHGVDAVILANCFHEHTPFAVKCLEKGIHVFCECVSNGTMAEGVELIRAAEKSNAVFMLAENYPQMKFNREIKRICDAGTLGKILYAEGEYNHPVAGTDAKFFKEYIYSRQHWRNFLPRTYYITHSLAPIMAATGATPKKVTAFAVFAPYEDECTAKFNADRAAIITTQNDDGSVFKVTGCAAFGAHGNSYRVCGTEGQIENLRGMKNTVMLRYNSWSIPEGMEENNCYEPEWNDKDEELIIRSGHGGGDFLISRMFLDCIKEKKQPCFPYDVHSAVAMSSVAILSHRSMLEGGVPYDIPDFHNEECRKQYENDTLSPFYGADGSEPTIPCCSHPDYRPTEEQLKGFDELIKN